MSGLFPVLVVTNFTNKLEANYLTKLKRLGFEPTFFTFSKLPDVLTVQQSAFGAVLAFQDHALQAQVRRAQELADKAGLPFARLLSQTSHSKEISDSLLPQQEGKDLLPYLVDGVEEKGRPWGWVLAHKVSGHITFPDSVTSNEAFLQYISRLAPENLPDSLRSRSKPSPVALPPSPPPSVPEVAEDPVQTTPLLGIPVEETEEYRLLKEEYDRSVANVLRLQQLLGEEEEKSKARLKQIEELSLEIARRDSQIVELQKNQKTSEKYLVQLASQWEERGVAKGRAAANQEFESAMRSLRLQVETLQKDLDQADQELAAVSAERQAVQEKLQSLEAEWASEKEAVADMKAIQQALRSAGFVLRRASTQIQSNVVSRTIKVR